ncbi:MAG: hypothetical protein BWX80_02408 [Candidatus Hydrogenedentes bacterium ADurb.Bin101]|nr:MAG: hypothetical protein BWX80_02408 [Candidatus Hydrogenedentes bacterium ADurb.Bin101]
MNGVFYFPPVFGRIDYSLISEEAMQCRFMAYRAFLYYANISEISGLNRL